MRFTLEDFVAESNRIEGIDEKAAGLPAHEEFLAGPLTVPAIEQLVLSMTGENLRREVGMNVRVARYFPPRGGPEIEKSLAALLDRFSMSSAFSWHRDYELLHPFMDGNGRSGRALWLRRMGGIAYAPLGFLHTYYYQSLHDASSRAATPEREGGA